MMEDRRDDLAYRACWQAAARARRVERARLPTAQVFVDMFMLRCLVSWRRCQDADCTSRMISTFLLYVAWYACGMLLRAADTL